MADRSKEELMKIWDSPLTTKENPLVLQSQIESENFSAGIRARNSMNSGNSSEIIVSDRDISFKEGHIFSHADGKHYPNRKAWEDHLKRNNCFEVGNEYNKKDIRDRKIRGNFDCRKELTEATKQILSRR